MTGWLLIVLAHVGGYASATLPVQVGPFATQAACVSAGTVLRAQPKDPRDGPLMDYMNKWVCVPQDKQD